MRPLTVLPVTTEESCLSKRRTERYWKSLKERDAAPGVLKTITDEFPEGGPRQFRRRDFLKATGFTLGAGCSPRCATAGPSNWKAIHSIRSRAVDCVQRDRRTFSVSMIHSGCST